MGKLTKATNSYIDQVSVLSRSITDLSMSNPFSEDYLDIRINTMEEYKKLVNLYDEINAMEAKEDRIVNNVEKISSYLLAGSAGIALALLTKEIENIYFIANDLIPLELMFSVGLNNNFDKINNKLESSYSHYEIPENPSLNERLKDFYSNKLTNILTEHYYIITGEAQVNETGNIQSNNEDDNSNSQEKSKVFEKKKNR